MAIQKTSSKSNGKARTSTKSLKKAGSSRVGDAKRSVATIKDGAADEVRMDRRRSDRRDEEGSVEEGPAAGPKLERRQKVNRRRQIDPTTCERDYNEQEIEFMNALDEYKRKSGRMFPTCSEVLEVIHSLGYAQLSAAERSNCANTNDATASAKPMPINWPAVAEASTHETGCGVSECDPQFAY